MNKLPKLFGRSRERVTTLPVCSAETIGAIALHDPAIRAYAAAESGEPYSPFCAQQARADMYSPDGGDGQNCFIGEGCRAATALAAEAAMAQQPAPIVNTQ